MAAGLMLGWGGVNKSIKTANTDLAMLKKNLTDIEQILNRIAKKSKDLKFPTSAGDKGRAGGKGRGGGGGRGGTKNGTGPSAVGGADVPDTGETNYDASSMRYNYIDPARPFSSAIINKFPRASVAVGVGSAVVGAGYQMLPGVEDSVARQQAIYQATLGYGFGTNMGSFMRMRSNINSAFGNTMTSPISGAATSAVLRDAGITVANSQGMLTSTAARMMQGAGAFSMLNGASNEQNATAMANVGTNFTMGNRLLMLGIRTLDKNGNPRNISDIANQLARRSFGRQGGKFNQRDLDRGLRGYLGGALAQYIPDADTRELAIQSLRVQAQAGGKNVPMTDASLRKIGIYNSLTNPMASLAQKTSAEARQSSMDQGALQGFDAANRNAARALDAVTDNLGGFGSALMRVKAYMETFMNSKPGGAVNSMLSTAGTVLGLRALGMGGGRGGAGGGAGGGLLTRAGGLRGGGLSTLGKGVGVVSAALGVGAVGLNSYQSYKDAKAGQGINWGAAGGAALSGAMAGASIGTFFAPATAGASIAIGAGIGAAVGFGANLIGHFAGSDGAQMSIINGGAGIGTAASGATGTSASGAAKLGTQYVGTKYVAGGRSPNQGWDCAGFVYYVFKKMGVILPQVSWEQVKRGRAVNYSEAKPGDLLFFHMPNGHRHDPGPMGINHVGIYLGNGKMVNAMNPKDGTRTTGVWTQYLKAVRRVLGGNLGKNPNGLLTSGSNASPISAGSILSLLSDYNQQVDNPVTIGTQITMTNSGLDSSMTSVSDFVGNDMSSSGMYNSNANNQSYGLRGSSASINRTIGTDLPATSGKKGSWSGIGLIKLLKNAGFSGEGLRTAYGVVQAESHGNQRSHNTNASTGDNSYGLFQLNMIGKMGEERAKKWNLKSYNELFDAKKNAKLAYQVSHHGTNWKPWSTYTSGKYKQYLPSKPFRSYGSGAWSVDSDQIAKIHQGEMIIPAPVAEAVRTGARSALAGQNGGGKAANVYITVQASGYSEADAMKLAKLTSKYISNSDTISQIGRS